MAEADDFLHAAVATNCRATRQLFGSPEDAFERSAIGDIDGTAVIRAKLAHKLHSQYSAVKSSPTLANKRAAIAGDNESKPRAAVTVAGQSVPQAVRDVVGGKTGAVASIMSSRDSRGSGEANGRGGALALYQPPPSQPSSSHSLSSSSTSMLPFDLSARSRALAASYELHYTRPVWHAPWKLMRVISGHTGWVRCVSVDPSNEFFVSGATDRTIKVWDLATGQLKLTLNGHVSTVRSVVVSPRHPYLISASEDKTVKCWDLETNSIVRNYHGHLSGVYRAVLHPALDLIVSGGRDGACRVWDIRTKMEVYCLSGHSSTVASLLCQSSNPQLLSGSHDSTVKFWDLTSGRCIQTLTHHKKSVRALVSHPREFSFASGSADHVKVWQLPEGKFLRNIDDDTQSIINALAINRENVLVSGGDDGRLRFIDWGSGHAFQSLQTEPQPGSIDSERAIFDATFDQTGSRLLTAECDKTIKVYKEDETATELSHPIQWKPPRRKY